MATGPRRAAKSLVPLPRGKPLWLQVYSELENAIIQHQIPPGSILIEENVAEQFGVSRVPVRESLRMLQRDGWLDLRPRGGVRVKEISVGLANDTFDLRRLLEAYSARRAALAPTDEALWRLRRIIEQERAALSANDQEKIIELNATFHSEIALMSGNNQLYEFSAEVTRKMMWVNAPFAGTARAPNVQDHEELVRKIAARDPDRAQQIAADHVESARRASVEREL